MLNGQLALHDVDDAFALCGGIIARSNLQLSWHDREELHAHLVAECWQLSLRYRPGTGSTTSFAGWATTTLRLRVVDWQRKHFGRTRWQFKDRTVEYERPQLLSLDADDSGRDRLERTLATGNGDRATDWDEAGGRLFGERDRTRVEDLEILGL